MRYLQFAPRRSLPAVLAAAVACALTSWISIGTARAGPAAHDGPSLAHATRPQGAPWTRWPRARLSGR